MYEYHAKVHRIIDGDTYELEVDVGFRLKTSQRFRLLGVNTPEIRGPERHHGLICKEFVARRIPAGKTVRVYTSKGDSFGRWLCELHYGPAGPGGMTTCLGEELVQLGFAVRWDGKGRRPTFPPGRDYPFKPSE